MPERRSALTSLGIHVLAVFLLFGLVTYRTSILPVNSSNPVHVPLIKPYLGKQGGASQPEKGPVQQGKLPARVQRQYVPVLLTPVNLNPKLPMVATIDVPPDIALPDSKLLNIGDPNGMSSLLPGGNRGRGGIGTGDGKNYGPGSGDGSPGIQGAIYIGGHDIVMPVAIKKVEPEFSEEARRARAMGIVVIYVEIEPDGKPHNLRVVRSFGLGLDEKALEAVTQWRFKPGSKDGKPVTVSANIELAFHLL
jgi:protein TonB